MLQERFTIVIARAVRPVAIQCARKGASRPLDYHGPTVLAMTREGRNEGRTQKNQRS
jgi:hypothetical protein